MKVLLFQAGFCAALLLLAAGCACNTDVGTEGDPASELGWHRKSKVGGPVAHVREACGGLKCELKHALFEEVEYQVDASDNIVAILLRAPTVSPPNVSKSQQVFKSTLLAVTSGLGPGKTLLDSGDPTYWPDRLPDERIVTVTMTAGDRTVLAFGPTGPDAGKIPPSGMAYKRAEVQKYWSKLFEAAEF
jgi:hypothetical protein